MSAAGPSQGANCAPSGVQLQRRSAAAKRGGTPDPGGAADGADRLRQVGARAGARRALPGRDRQRRFRAGLSRHGHRDGEARRRDARARAAPSDRHHRSRPRRIRRRAFAPTRSQAIAAIRSRGAVPLLVGGTMLYFKALQRGTLGVAGRRSRGARASRRPRRGRRLAGAARRARARRSRHGRRGWSRPTRSASSARSKCTRSPAGRSRSCRARAKQAAGRADDRARARPGGSRARCIGRSPQRFDAMLARRPRDRARGAARALCADARTCRRCAASATGRRGQFLDGAHRRRDAARERHRRDAPTREAPVHVAARDAGDGLRPVGAGPSPIPWRTSWRARGRSRA